MPNLDYSPTSRTSTYVKTSPLRHTLPALAAAALLFLTACEDPSNVGLGLVGEQGGEPITTQEAISNLSPDSLERPAGVPLRVLAGTVDDPLFGTISAEGYLDFTPVSGSDFREGTIEAVELRLLPTYVYGDTTQEITLAIRPVMDEWSTTDIPVDTTFEVGPVIREFTFQATDSIVVIPMPDTWVSSNDELLRSEDFAEDFHGFHLDQISGNAVVGFGPNATVLRSFTEEDSASYPIGKAYSALSKNEEALPTNRVLIQAGVGPEAEFEFELEDDEDVSAINRVALTFRADTLTFQQNQPAGFVRPMLRTLDLYGNTTDGSLVLLARSNLDDRGRFIFQSEVLAREIQSTLIGDRSYENFELRVPTPATVSDEQIETERLSASISSVLLYGTGGGEQAPTAYLTITPIDG